MKAKFSLQIMASCAMMTALAVVLNRFLSIHTAGWTIGFSFVPVALTAILYGPAAAAAVGGLSDLVGAILFPFGPYFPGFTATAALMGAMYGWFLYRKRPMALRRDASSSAARFFPHLLIPTLVNTLILGLCINTLWVSILYGSRTYWGWFVYRLPEYAVLIPVHLLLLPLLLQLAEQLRKSR